MCVTMYFKMAGRITSSDTFKHIPYFFVGAPCTSCEHIDNEEGRLKTGWLHTNTDENGSGHMTTNLKVPIRQLLPRE